MKKLYSLSKFVLVSILCLSLHVTQAQNVPNELGKCSTLVSQFQVQSSSSQRGEKPALTLKVSNTQELTGQVNVSKSEDGGAYAVGQLTDGTAGTFFVHATPTSLTGHVIIKDAKWAFQYYSDEEGNAFVKQVDVNQLLCIDYTPVPPTKSAARVEAVQANSPEIFLLESLPGAAGCIYLDFDGETVTGTAWKGGATIVALPSNMSDELIRQTWEVVAEDYRPFNINVTTNRNVFNTYPKNRRMMHISTTSKDVTTTGVAYIGSFNWNDDTPCWGTYTDNGKTCGEVASHEVGHTFDLGHDGRILNNDPNTREEYYGGADKGLSAPIMGAGYYNPLTQWSKGDYYAYPTNTQDDLATISGTKFGVGYRADVQGNTTATAAPLPLGTNGVITATSGIIEKTNDLDFFSFNTSGGAVIINVNTVSRNGDLNIVLKLYNQSGALIGTFDTPSTFASNGSVSSTGLNASISQNLAAGTYYLSVDGGGDGDPFGKGYSEYGSLGSYTITGTIPFGTVTLRPAENPANTVGGLDYKYYEGLWSAIPAFASLTPVKTGTSATPDLSGRNKDDQFGFSYTGFFNAPSDGSYTFYTSSDDGSQLFIGSTLVVNNDGLHGAVEASGTIGLKAGKHAITVLFFEQGGDQVLTTSYSGPSINKQAIPAGSFFRIPAPVYRATVYQHCNYDASGYGIGLEVGDYTTAQLAAKGILDNDASSLKVVSGYEVVLYELDNFQGSSQTFSADNTCLVANGINDWASSIKVRAVAVTNVPPTVSLTAPANNATYTAPASITISANASDSDGSVSKVDFYNGTTLVGSDNTAPYSVVWSSVAAGTYTITAKATDDKGAVTTSSSVSVLVNPPANVPPTITLTAPANNATYTAPASITISATAGDSDGSVSKVDFYNGTTLVGSDNTAPYSVVWSSVAAGTYTISAKATDDKGAVTTSSSVSVVVNNPTVPNVPPTITLTAPINNATYTAPAAITISANAADSDGTVSKVDFYNGTTLISSDLTSPYSIVWSGVAVGTYTISAKATDDKGAVTSSSSVSVTVNAPTLPNVAPTVSLTSPANNASYTAPASITITANASDADGSVSKVEFYNGSTLVGSDNSSPYSVTWSNVAAGTYSLSVKATDNQGATVSSGSVSVVVTNPQTNLCAGVAQYVEANNYVPGSNVQNGGSRYQCRPWPNSGWCNAAAWAYGPGTGMYWQDAWTLVGSCSAAKSEAIVQETALTNAPNPFTATTTIDVTVADAGAVSLKVYDKTGKQVAVLADGYFATGKHSFEWNGADLPADVYIVRYESSNQVIVRKIMKAQ